MIIGIILMVVMAVLFGCGLYKDHQRFKAKMKAIEAVNELDIPLGEKVERLNNIN